MKKWKIQVTAKDIKGGSVGNPWYCPIALAVNRSIKMEDSIVASGTVRFQVEKKYPREYVIGLLPQKARHFYLAFDDGIKVKPFEFILRQINYWDIQ